MRKLVEDETDYFVDRERVDRYGRQNSNGQCNKPIFGQSSQWDYSDGESFDGVDDEDESDSSTGPDDHPDANDMP